MAPKKKVKDVTELNKTWVPIPALRLELTKLTKEGYEKYPLGELLLMINDLVRKES
jgi:hypothetical protein